MQNLKLQQKKKHPEIKTALLINKDSNLVQ